MTASPEVDAKAKSKLSTHTSESNNMFAGSTGQELAAGVTASPLEVGAAILIVSMETGWIDAVSNINLNDNWHSLRGTVDPLALRKTDTVVLQAIRP